MMNIRYLFVAVFAGLTLLTSCENIDESDRLIEVTPTEVSRAVLVEEFSGQFCVNCPYGAAQLHRMEAEYGADSLVVVTIHCGVKEGFGIDPNDPDLGPLSLVTADGELVGINAMLYSETGSYSGYGFAIPTAIMNKVVSDLKQYGTVQRAYLGIRGSDLHNQIDNLKDQGKDVPDYGTNTGVYVASVEDDGAGASAGLKEGDVITKIDGKTVAKMPELQQIINNKKPGDKATITWLRNKKEMSKTVVLKNKQGNTKIMKSADFAVLGANVLPVSENLKKQLGINYGLQVKNVKKGSFKDGGIDDGFIILTANDKPMKTIADLQEAVKEASLSKNPVLFITGVWPSGKTDYKAIKVGE